MILRGATFFTGVVIMALGPALAWAEILIATAGPMTGQYAWFGEQYARGAEMAVDDINAAGGVLGETVRIIVGDDSCDPEQAVAVANSLANDGVVFVAGHYCSHSSIPASKVYENAGILMISPASTNPRLTDEGGPNVFRVCGRDDLQGRIAGDYLADH
ncbi:MAG: branched-chain amino acid ABC transporter substrate-binding protein, partial [Alphaproteobacteria bacterium]|nr:branched-chain amino acid ABC transporter substrate-binding protein [Alphaproteobacteria bacterium]